MRTNRAFSYQQTRVLAAPPDTLLRIALEEAIKACHEALACLKAGDIARRSGSISRAMNILTLFGTMLNDAAAPELCMNLRRLCDYAHRRLLEAHMQQSETLVHEVIDLIQPIAEAWSVVERRPASMAVAN